MPKKVEDKTLKLFKDFLSGKKVLIVDTNASARTGLAKTMIDLGAQSNLVTLADGYVVAEKLITSGKPQVIITEYDLEKGRCGLELLQQVRENDKEIKNELFVLVTANTSQSAVAQAAEEDVDLYILKPYTLDKFKKSLLSAGMKKIAPSEYLKSIDLGKELLFSGKAKESLEYFNKAKKLDSAPALALCYHGQAQVACDALNEAASDFQDGLRFNPIHYKCLVGLYDVYLKQRKYSEAYEIVKKIVKFFPANPHRLSEVLRLAIVTKHYEDIERYYEAFTQIAQRKEELTKVICAALIVTGKYFLQENNPERSVDFFKKAAITSGNRPAILKEIITLLLQHHCGKEAEEFLKRYPPDLQSASEFLTLEFLVTDKINHSGSLIIDKGRKLIASGIREPDIYIIMIKRYLEAKLGESADQVAYEASKIWPNQKNLFEGLLK